MLVVTGAVAFDYIFPLDARFAEHILPEKLHVINISCVVDGVDQRFGGTAGNQAYTLALLGARPILLASAGRDFGPYDLYLRKAGVDTSFIARHDDLLTACAFALYDKDDNQIWGFAKNAMLRARELSLTMIKKAIKFVLITPDEFEAVANYLHECQQLKIPYAFDPAFDIPKLKPAVLKKGVENASVIFGNDYEISLLVKRTGLSWRKLTEGKIVVTTLGSKGSIIEVDGHKYHVRAAKPRKIVSPSGAGDAYRGGFLAGFLKGYSWKTCGQMGSLAAVYALEHHGTIEHKFSREEFCRRYEKEYGERLVI